VDEAASRLKMEIDSLPEPIDQLERRLIALAIEEQALGKEKDEASASAWSRGQGDLRAARARRRDEEHLAAGEGLITEIRKLKEDIEKARTEAEQAQRKRRSEPRRGAAVRSHARAGEGSSPPRTRAEVRTGHGSFLREEVTEEDIAAVVSKWTGIPVDKMLESEQARLLHLEERLHQRVIGQDEAVKPSRTRFAAPAPACRIPTGPSVRSSSSARPASGRPSWRARWPSSCSTTSRTWFASTCPSTWRSTRCRG
jgi:ATP-dependent Clp protease ATP-binding subunit ClpB